MKKTIHVLSNNTLTDICCTHHFLLIFKKFHVSYNGASLNCGVHFIFLQDYYITTARELARMVGIRKAPFLHHFSESVSGAATFHCCPLIKQKLYFIFFQYRNARKMAVCSFIKQKTINKEREKILVLIMNEMESNSI